MSQTAHQVGASGTQDGELPSDAAASLSVSSASLENSAAKGGRKKTKTKTQLFTVCSVKINGLN